MAGEPVMKGCDVLGMGIVAVDDLLTVAAFPAPESKVYVLRRDRQCGGLCGTALVAAARLGARCVYAGSLGRDEASAFVRSALEAEGIVIDSPRDGATGRPYRSTIVVDESAHTRTILVEPGVGLGDEASWPTAEAIRSSRVLLVDHQDIPQMIRGAREARAAGVAVVSDVELDETDRTRELLALVDHLVVGEAFARQLTGASTPGDSALALWVEGRSAVVVTCGSDGAWFVDEDRAAPRHQRGFAVEVADTTGCGDVFHGAYAAELARGVGLAERVRFACACAALKATRSGGQAGIASRASVESFLREQTR